MPPSPAPVANPTISFWREPPHSLDNYRSTPDLPQHVDVAVIGAGFAGISTVYHILDRCKTRSKPIPSIAILEARQACNGASGRNGGHIKPDPCNRPAALVDSHGAEAAAECAAFEAQNLSAVKMVIEREGVDCDFVMTRAIDVMISETHSKKMKSNVERLRKAGLSVMDDVQFMEGPDAEEMSGIKGAKGCVSYSAAHLWPSKLILHMLSKAIDAGVNVQTNTPVLEVTKSADAEGYFTITTPRGSVHAKNIVYATNGYTSSLMPEFAEKIVPVRGICSHIKPVKKVAPFRSNSYMIRWSETNYEYLIPRLDGSIIVGGGRPDFYHDLPSWYGNVNDDSLIESATKYFDNYMQRVFHGWEDSGAYTAKLWTGIMGYSTDGMPFIGHVPGRKNQFMLAGFTGHGMPQVFLSAKGIAAMLLDGAGFRDTGVPRIYEVTQARLDNPRNSVLEDWKKAQAASDKSNAIKEPNSRGRGRITANL
ncbi:FAD dependent oxidoreductase [Xylariales sp. PMI_506]|nr:FAD dependent oxidoreductase [Xylariales sp. PMI_506]